jgi:hypothetical protein
VHAPWLGAVIGMILSTALYIQVCRTRRKSMQQYACQLNTRIPAEMREFIRTLQQQFEAVFVITEATHWTPSWPATGSAASPPAEPDGNFLVVVRKDKDYWLAATVLAPPEKAKPSAAGLAIDDI